MADGAKMHTGVDSSESLAGSSLSEDNPARVVDVFVDELDLKALGFEGMSPASTGRPAHEYQPYTG